MSLNIGTYECTECGDRQDFRKQYGVDWPESLKCPFCQTMSAHKMIVVPGTHFPEGRLGNGKNGYTNTKKELT